METELKLVLLPGMDGTGELFDEFLSGIGEIEYLVIPLPKSGPQDYFSLRIYVEEKLPNHDFIFLAESFSGAIASQIAFDGMPFLKGIIFVGSFLSAPNRLVLSLAKFLPIKTMLCLPFHEFMLRKLMLGAKASQSLLTKFKTTVKSVPGSILKARISTMQDLLLSNQCSEIPAFYIGGNSDQLVNSLKAQEFKKCFSRIEFSELDGAHFLLQSNPAGCAHQVTEILSRLTNQSSSQTMVAGSPQSGAPT